MSENHEDRKNAGLSRRSALIGVAVGAGGSLAARAQVPTRGGSSGGNGDAYDVVILGGGMAGATAARELGTRGLRCLVLEARGRVGGRTFTTEVFGERADVGGQWIHWIQPHVWAETQRYGLQLAETPGANPTAYGIFMNGKLQSFDPAKAFAAMDSGMRKFTGNTTALFPRPYDPTFNPEVFKQDSLSVADRLRQVKLTPVERAVLEAFFTTAANGPVDQTGFLDHAHWAARADGSLDLLLRACTQFKISTGTASLIDLMFKDSGATVRLNSTVTRVQQTEAGVKVVVEDGFVATAPHCIVALPMNCWGDIDWQPGIAPGKLAASKDRHAGQGFELKIKVKGNKGAYQGMAPGNQPISMIYADKITNEYTIMIGMGFPVKGFDVNDDDHVKLAVQRIMPGAEVLESYAYDWNADPYSKGTWCTYRPGMWSKFGAAMRQKEGRLIFAGSDIADGWRGFIDGAIETGLRASRDVLTARKGA
jgi:monoamine oxidase